MSEILLFDIFEPQSGDGVSTGGVYPSRIRWVIVLPREIFKKYTPKESISCNFIIYIFSIPFFSCGLSYTCQWIAMHSDDGNKLTI